MKKKEKKNSIKKNSFVEGTFIATASIFITKILGMLYVIPFYAMVGPKGGALYAYAYSIYVIFLDISSAGLPIAISKVISEYNTLGMMEAKKRAFKIGKRVMVILATIIFTLLMIFAPQIASLLLGDLEGGNTIEDVALAIRCVSFAILIVPYLSVSKGFLQGHNFINIPSVSQIIEQIVRIIAILGGCYLVLYVFKGSVTNAVCLSVFAAFLGGLAAYIFIKYQMKKHDVENIDSDYDKVDPVSNKDIAKKIFSYAVPFIIINIVSSCYNFIDMTLLLRTMNYLNMPASEIEFAAGAVTAWAPKINMIVTSVAMGMSTSFIPTMVSAYTLKNWKLVNSKFNQAIQMLIFISLPMTIGISMLSKEIWTVFYGFSNAGSTILAVNIFVGLIINVYMITSTALQGLNRFKTVYLSTILGFVVNALLDAPLMILYHHIDIPPYLGAITATMIGYSLSIIITLVSLKKECKLEYKSTFKVFLKICGSLLLMMGSVYLVGMLFNLNYNNRFILILYIAIEAIVGAIVYFISSYKFGIIDTIFGEDFIPKIVEGIKSKFRKEDKNAS